MARPWREDFRCSFLLFLRAELGVTGNSTKEEDDEEEGTDKEGEEEEKEEEEGREGEGAIFSGKLKIRSESL